MNHTNQYTVDELRAVAAEIIRQARATGPDTEMIEVSGHGLTVFAYLNDGRVLVADVLADNDRCSDDLRNILRNLITRLSCVPP